MIRTFKIMAMIVVLALGSALPISHPASAYQELVEMPLVIKTSEATVKVTVELAASFEEKRQGLMHRTELAPDRGMLFLYKEPRAASFWMRNTLISLDMIFIRADGSIANIRADVPPNNDLPRKSDGEIIAVLELKGGRAAELGIKKDDHVLVAQIHRMFARD